MKILGVDPGIGRVGWGIIEEEKGILKAIKFDCFETKVGEKTELRLQQINQFLVNIIDTEKPDCASVEKLFFAANSKTAIVVGEARGAILLSISQAGLPVFSYTPLQVKQALTGYGRADKKQIQYMVMTLLNLKEIPKQDDAADALAIAITHAFSYKINSVQSSKCKVQNYSSKLKSY